MDELVSAEDWGALQDLLATGIKLIETKQVDRVKLGILEFYSTASMLGLEDIAGVAKKFEEFLLQKVAPGWGGEATATLSFSMGGLLEQMQLNAYSSKFSAGLGEILQFMEFYEEDEPAPAEEPPAPAPAPPAPPAKAAPVTPPAPEPPPPEPDLMELALSLSRELAPEPDAPPPKEVDLVADSAKPAPPPPSPEPVRPAAKAAPAKQPETPPAPKPTPKPVESRPAPQKPGRGLEIEKQPRYKDTVPRKSRARSTDKPAADAIGYVMDGIEWYREILREDPASRVFVPLAEELCSRELWGEAVDVCRRGLVRHPFDLRAVVLLGWSLLRLGELEQAKTVLEEAQIELQKNAIVYGALAEIAEASGDADSANRLQAIFQNLQSTGPKLRAWHKRSGFSFEPDFEIRDLASSDDLDLDDLESELNIEIEEDSSSLTEFLSALMRSFEEEPSKPPTGSGLFSPTDREALKSILHGRVN